jgi:hypothetical protein
MPLPRRAKRGKGYCLVGMAPYSARIFIVAVKDLKTRSPRSYAPFSGTSNQISPGATHEVEPQTSAV